MKTDRLVIFSFLFTAIGVIWLATHWNGSVGFNFAYPIAGCSFTFNVTNTGASALFGVLFTVVGLVLFFVCFVAAVWNSLSSKRV